jgi:hypothetical protein
MGLAVGPERFPSIAEVRGHPRDIGLEAIEIEHEGRGRDVVARAHPPSS